MGAGSHGCGECDGGGPVRSAAITHQAKAMEHAVKKIVLFGASGPVGQSVAGALSAVGIPCRVAGRTMATLQTTFGRATGIEMVTWNTDDRLSVARAAEGADTLVYMVGVPYDRFHLHPVLLEKVLEGAIAAGVKRFLLIGTLYSFGMAREARISEEHPREPHTRKGRFRKAQEDVLMAAHAEGRIEASILRLPDFYGPGVEKSFLHDLFVAAVQGRRARMIGPIDVSHEFVFVPDVGEVVRQLAIHPGAYGRTWNLGGAEVVTQREVMERAFALAGTRPRAAVAGKTTLRLLGLFDPFARELVEMHYLVSDPLIVDDRALHEMLGEIHKTPLDEGIRRCLLAAGGGVVEAGAAERATVDAG